ncbi:YSIRK signal domain/LPXTG anchor domain surface protein [Ligilactobacillus apodemi]|uniref:Mucus binding protein n=1 Tax=Ligilactobacillus apodemi DSM 16634 = JCM 16172 TaxID=1423724 RepID=A0A0R1U318_9LACO|nr:YSIRK signal domain/LPXTG anchor domain surface protein [Ligilactobacillus apodemi]KRL85346.1 mucus binding protein [Ligilactobacillus apodemi DSM 16634 = JCM 16172]
MVSKKNKNFYLRKSAKKVSKYAIKKLSVGVASVLLSTAFFMGSTSGVKASADVTETATEVLADSTATSEAVSNEEAAVVTDSSATEQAQSEAEQETASSAAVTNSATSESASSEAVSEAQSEAPAQATSEENATSEAPASQATSALATASEASQATTEETKATEANVGSEQATVATSAEETQTAPASENTTSVFRSVAATTRAAADSTASDETTVNSWSQLVNAMRNSSVTNIKVTGTITALGSGNIGSTGHKVTVKGENAKLNLGSNTLVATGSGWDITFDGLTITTGNAKGVIDLSSSYGSNKVTFKDVTQSGTSLYGGGGNTEVIIDGTTVSTVNNASAGKANTYDATSREANIHSATKVTVAEGANFTLNRSSIGDAINLPNGSTVEVKDKGTLTINMNTSNATDSARYHNAGIFMLGGGTVKTGKNSTLNINSSIGQAISIAITRPADTTTDADRYGGYDISHSTTVDDENTAKKGRMQDGPVVISIGEDANFNFTGRDGIITGHNATFTTGEGSVTHFKNNGRGVAIDMGDNSHIKFGKKSINTFESDGKGPRKGATAPSGGYAGYNYIGVDEGGTITVDDYATFRVYMNNRGANPWDDVISLDTRKTGGYPLFVVNKGAIVDIRDDNTDYYAELISIPLGNAQNTGYQFNSPLFVSFQRYTSSNGWVSSDITGKLPENVPQGNNPESITRASSNILYVSNKAATGNTYLEFNALENGGTYTVYSLNIGNAAQKDVNKQSSVWTNINSGKFSIWGFQNNKKDITPADALSEQTGSSTGGVPATSKQGLYDIDPVLKNRQNVWIPNETVISPEAHHTNTIKYVYEDGSPVLDENGNPIVSVQSSDWERTMKIKLALEDFRKKLRANSVRTADEFLRVYNQALYELGTAAGDDTGWVVKGTENTKATYDTVVSPKADRAGNYVLTVKDTNADGVTVGANGSSVTAILNKDNITDTLTSDLNGAKVVSQSYWNNFSNVGFTKDYVTTVVYKKISTQVLTYTVIDDTTKTTLVDAAKLAEGDSSSAVPASVATSYEAIQKSYTDKGYVVKSADALPTTFDDDDAVNQNVTIHLEHATVPVTPENPQTPGTPINPNDPDGPKWPNGTDKDSLQKVVKETVSYVGANALTPTEVVQTATYTKSVTVDKVTGEIVSQTDWTPDKTTYDEVKTPVVPGYYADKATVPGKDVVPNDIVETVTYKPLGHIVPVDPDGNPIPGADTPIYNNDPTDPTKVVPNQPVPEIPGYTPQVPTVTPNDPGTDTKVVYVKDADQVAKVTYIDDTTNKTLETADLTGQAGATSDYRTADTIAKYLAQGYELVSNNYPANGVVFDDDDNTVQSFEVHLKHAVVPVGPNDPHTPGTPINPDDPDGQKWPSADQYTKEYTSTVHFVDEAGNKVFDDNTQTSTWTRTLLVDKVTGEVQNPDEPWTADKAQYDAVTVPVKEDYYADKNRVVAKDTVQKDLEETVVYKPLGHIVPVDKDGNEIPKAPTPQYNNDPNDPTKGTTTSVPDIPGYHPEVPSVTPTDPGKDTPVVYVKDEDPVKPDPTENDQKATIIYRDITTDTVLDSVSLTGKSETAINYSTADKIKELTDKGYVLVNDGFPSDATFDNNDDVDQTYYVTVKHGEEPVGPNNPHEPGTPINPNDPDGPKWPSTDEYSKEYTSTVHFVDENGNKVFDDDVQTSTWTRTLIIDTVTGEIKNPQESWKADKDKYSDVLAPILPKYYADKNRVVGQVTEQSNLEDTIVYKPLGHIVPVDEDGNEIPKAPTPQYNNDPTDPTKGGSTPVPDIPGYHPEVPSVTPTDPGADTPVKYIKDKDPEKPTTPSENDQKATIIYRDLTTDTILDSASVTGKPNTAIEYSTAATIKELTDKGYVLVNDGFPSDATFDNNDNVDQTYYVTVKHGEEPVGPNNPHEPGTPINPNDPDGPKWPSIDEYSKEYSSTVHFVDENGNKVFDDNVQTSTWTRTLIIDTVTGEVKNPQETWKADKDKYSAVVAPVKEDYYADKASVGAKDVVQDNLEDTIVYKPLGHIVPVDPDGNPIPNAPTPEYNNDPKDPTKGGETPVPNIPGYHPEVPSVTPDKPGEDTPVKYIKDAVNYSLTEKFVDENGNELSPTVVKGSDYKQGDSYDVSGDAQVIKGYYLKAVSDNAKGTFGEADVTVTFTYAKLGNIVPVDPSGTPIPDAPTPPYKNDPNDPTKGGETPVPVIPGYKPEIPSVTPDKPGEDTPVVYVPVTPEKDAQAVRIIYRDITNDMVLDSVDLSGKAGEKVEYSTADKIKELTDKGYVLVNDGFPSDAVFDDDANVDQTYYVTLKHGEEPVGPNNPHEPGTPINPNDPDGPKWPSTDQYSKQYTSTVQFVDDKGNKLRDDDVQTSTWTRTLLIDTVTGEIKNPTEPWTSDIAKYADVTAPVIKDYYADKSRVTGKTAVEENLVEQIVYKPLGHIVPVDPEGNPIPGADTPQFNNDPNDPTKGGTTPVPEIPDYTPRVPSVTPENPGKDVPVIYDKKEDPNKPNIPNDHKQLAKVIYRDITTDTDLVTDKFTGEAGAKLDYSTTATIKELTDKGYVLVSDGFPSDAVFDDDANVDQTYYVTFKHGEEPVGPNNPHEPGTPINPNDPDGPKWPAKDEYSKEYTSTVHFVDKDGNKLRDDDVQTSTWTRTLIVDTVTGEIKNPNEAWKANKANYDEVTAPVITGYYADKDKVAGLETVQANLENSITYNKLGNIVPVDPSGNPIPNAPTPSYNNDPKDPTKGGETPVPEIPGYQPQVPNVTPEDPGKDTLVVYVPVTPEKQTQTAKIIYVDETTGKTLETDVVTGKSGDKIDYSTAPKIKELKEKGYVVVENGFPTNAIFDDNDAKDQVYVVKLGHDTAPVGPNDPHEPGTPINPNDPNGPKWPAKDEYSKEYTSTVHFVDENGNKLREDDVQTSTWTRTLIVDKVTGEVLNPSETWTADKANYAQVKVPVITGYVADKAVVPAQATQQQDLETTVTYKKIGMIVPVDPAGNPIPGAPTPQYKNDPNDPTKVVVTSTPDVPGYNTDTPSVDPADPTANTQVVYKKVVTPAEPAKPTPTAQPETKRPVVEPTATKTQPKQDTPAKNAEELPQTGDSENNVLAALGATMVASLLGLVGLKKRRKDEQDS